MNHTVKTEAKIKGERNRYHYWIAVYIDCGNGLGTFIPTTPLSYSRAISYARAGGSLFSDTSTNAYRVALAAGNGRTPIWHPHTED